MKVAVACPEYVFIHLKVNFAALLSAPDKKG